jgi:penicillin V acylase-like amidase (Ntn superfamily)
LDNYANLKEVIKNLNSLQIINTASELHYTVCDAGQNCAVIAPVDGKLKAYTAETLPVTVSTNTVYEKNLEYFKSKNFQSVSDVPLDFNLEEQGVRESENRFCRAAILVEKYNPTNEKETIEYANKILKEVEAKVTTWTKVKHFFGSFLPASYWKIIYNTKEKIVNFSTYDSPDGKHLDLKKLDFSCKTSRKILDLNSPVSGDILDKLQDYSTQANRDLLSKTMIFIEGKIPKQALEFLAIYPEKLLCAE